MAMHSSVRLNQSDFARCKADSQNPEMWDGLVGAFCPSLGPSGTILPNWRGGSPAGTFANSGGANPTFTFDSRSGWKLAGNGLRVRY